MPKVKTMVRRKESEVVGNGFLDEKFPIRDAIPLPAAPEYHQESAKINGLKSYTDAYRYLRDPKDKRTKEALKLESRYAEAFLGRPRFAALQRELFREMKSMIDATEVSLPVLEGSFWYYVRYEENEEYPLHCRRPCDPEHGVNKDFLEEACEWREAHPNGEPLPRYPDEVIFLDLNLLVKELNLKYVEIGDMDISFDETKLAVTLDCSGGKEIFSLFIFEICDVNYRKWIDCGASDAQRAWVHSLDEGAASIYMPVHSPRSNRSSPVFPSSPGPRRACKKRPLDLKQASPCGVSSPSPNSPDDRIPLPWHRCLQKIELFDLSGDVLWVNPTCVMYSVLDEKLRPFQIVFHDTAVDPTDPNATWICYEEEDEMFWLGSLSFTADDCYLVFSSTSTEVSEWFLCPTEGVPAAPAGGTASLKGKRRRPVSKVPFFCKRMAHMEHHARQSGSELDEVVLSRELTTEAHFKGQCAPTARFTLRGESLAEYDLAHHEWLLGPSEGSGAWVMTSNARGCTNFAVFFLPDEDAKFDWEVVCPVAPVMGCSKTTSDASKKKSLSARGAPNSTSSSPQSSPEGAERMNSDAWPLLFEYDPTTKVESVECFRDFLLITVHRNATSEVLFCPLHLIWDWWTSMKSRQHTQNGSSCDAPMDLSAGAFSLKDDGSSDSRNFPPPLSLRQIIPLTRLLRQQFDQLESCEWFSFDVQDELTRTDKWDSVNPSSCQAALPIDIAGMVEDSDRAFLEQKRACCNPLGKGEALGFCFPSPMFFEDFQEEGFHRISTGAADASEKGLVGRNAPPQRGVAPSVQPAHGLLTAPVAPARLCATPLPDSLESYATQVDFSAQTFALAMSHLLRPTTHYHLKYLPPPAAEACAATARGSVGAHDGPTAKGTLLVKRLRREVVRGRTYHPSEYSGFVLWVPSDYAFTQGPGRAALTPVPTKDPSEPVRVPVFTIWRTDLFRKNTNSAVLNVYGSYGDSFESEFSVERLALLDRGFVWAYAAVRGGGELGIPWRDAGRKLQRATSVNDFVSVSSFLIDVGLCAKGFLTSSGSSAGGMIVCRAVNCAPHLFLAVASSAPFVDCLATLLDSSLPLTVTEREEFGDPTTSEAAFDLIQEISPVLTVPSQATAPNMLLVTSLEDTRVGFWEPMKLAAIMRSQMVHGEAIRRLVVFTCDTHAGHSGASGRYAQIKEIAREYAFVIDTVRREREHQNSDSIVEKYPEVKSSA